MARTGFSSLVGGTVVWGVAFVAFASCGGVSTRHVADDDDASGNAGTGGTATGGMVAIGGTITGGSVGQGGGNQGGRTGTAGRGTMPGAGRPGVGGRSGQGGVAGRGGTAGTAGDGGAGPTAGEPGCRFEALPEGYRCENAGSRVQDDTSRRVGAGTLSQCEDRCMMDPACTAITDYFGEMGVPSCNVLRGSCGDAVFDIDGEEDASKDYRKVCDAMGCRLEYLGHWMKCTGGVQEQWMGATSRADCDRACLADASCGGVIDYFWIAEIAGCYLYTSTCDNPEPLPFGDPGRTYVMTCD